MRPMRSRISILRFLVYAVLFYGLYRITADMGWNLLSTIFKWIFYAHIGIAVLIAGFVLLIFLLGLAAMYFARKKMQAPAKKTKSDVMDANYTIKQ